MELYSYKGRNKLGDVVTGTIEAANTEGVVNWLLASGIAPIDVKVKEDPLKDLPDWLQSLQGGGSLGPAELLLFTRLMSSLVKAGVPMNQAIGGLKTSADNPRLARVLMALHSAIENGSELSAAMTQFPKFFDDYYVNMVKVGESSGRLDEIFESLFEQLDFDRRLSRKISSVLRYPMFVMSAIVIAMVIMMIYVIPSFASVYGGMKAELPFVTQILVGTSDAMLKYWWLLLALTVGAVVGGKFYLASPEGRFAWDRAKLRIPVIGRLVTKGTTARLCRGLGTAMKSGVPIVTAMTLVSRVVNNAFYAERILLMRESVSNGYSLVRSFMAAGIFNPIELQMVQVGEDAGDVEGMIHQLAELYKEEVEYESNRLAESLEPILLAFMAILVGILLLGVFLPMWNMTDMVK